jgi:hypothetical protein
MIRTMTIIIVSDVLLLTTSDTKLYYSLPIQLLGVLPLSYVHIIYYTISKLNMR